jgi:uncharacterized protein YjiS (DUF1127 family)
MSDKRKLSNNHSLTGTLKFIRSTPQAFADRVANARRMRRELLELSAMSDIELHDIGIGREDILAVISGSYDAGLHRS